MSLLKQWETVLSSTRREVEETRFSSASCGVLSGVSGGLLECKMEHMRRSTNHFTIPPLSSSNNQHMEQLLGSVPCSVKRSIMPQRLCLWDLTRKSSKALPATFCAVRNQYGCGQEPSWISPPCSVPHILELKRLFSHWASAKVDAVPQCGPRLGTYRFCVMDASTVHVPLVLHEAISISNRHRQAQGLPPLHDGGRHSSSVTFRKFVELVRDWITLLSPEGPTGGANVEVDFAMFLALSTVDLLRDWAIVATLRNMSRTSADGLSMMKQYLVEMEGHPHEPQSDGIGADHFCKQVVVVSESSFPTQLLYLMGKRVRSMMVRVNGFADDLAVNFGGHRPITAAAARESRCYRQGIETCSSKVRVSSVLKAHPPEKSDRAATEESNARLRYQRKVWH